MEIDRVQAPFLAGSTAGEKAMTLLGPCPWRGVGIQSL